MRLASLLPFSDSVETIFGRRPQLMAALAPMIKKHVVHIASVDQCIAYRPGILSQAHVPDEHCLIEYVVNSAKVMALTVIQLLGAEEVSSKR